QLFKSLVDMRQGDYFLERPGEKFRNQADTEVRLARALDDQRQLGGGFAHFHRRADVRILRAVNQVRPVDQVRQVGSLETKAFTRGVGDELGTRAEVRPIEFL